VQLMGFINTKKKKETWEGVNGKAGMGLIQQEWNIRGTYDNKLVQDSKQRRINRAANKEGKREREQVRQLIQ